MSAKALLICMALVVPPAHGLENNELEAVLESARVEMRMPGLRAAESEAGRESGACALAPYVLTSIQEDRELAVRDAKNQIGFYFTTALYHSILDLHGMREVE